MREVLAFNALEDEREAGALQEVWQIDDSINLRNVRMTERREDLRLALEPCQPIAISGKRRRQDLDGDVAMQLGVVRSIDFAHAADAEHGEDLEPAGRVAEAGAGAPVQPVPTGENLGHFF